jgi:hypothetical protein
MINQRVFPFFLILLLGAAFVSAQEEGAGELPIDSDWSGILPSLYEPGDQMLTMTAGMVFPTLFLHHDGPRDPNIYPGGVLALSYVAFLTPQVFMGGELGGMAAGTKGKNMVYLVSVGFRAGYQFLLGRFEFPLSLVIGGCPQKFQDDGYFGLILKPGAGAFFRFNPEFSFGISADWWWVPQWTGDRTRDVYGNFLDFTLSVRYHF